jgi:cobalamin biosynthesis Mg chelatase CobN
VYQYCSTSIAAGCFILSDQTSIADTGRFWKILVIPVLQILEDSGKYWLYQYCRYWKIGRIPVNPSFYVYIILKELTGIYNTHILAMTSIF